MGDFPEINTHYKRPEIDPLRFRIGNKPLYIGMNDINEFPFIKGMDPWLEEILGPNTTLVYDTRIIMCSLAEWKAGIRHNHKTCKGRSYA